MRILVTGAGGFIGRSAVAALRAAGHHVRGCGRGPAECAGDWARMDLGDPAGDLAQLCADMDCVVHLAACVHERAWQRLAAPRRMGLVNAEGTRRLAEAAQGAGVRKFIFLSSIGVYGGGGAHRYTESDPPQPRSAYARSKLKAEQHLQEICRNGAMSAVIVRAPLVFGAAAPGNFGMLLRGLQAGWPIPVAPDARRSLLYVENLAGLLSRCVEASVENTLFLASDHDFGVADLVSELASALGRDARLVELAPGARPFLERLSGLHGLTRSLLVDSRRVRAQLHWSPEVDSRAAIARTAAAYLRARSAARQA